MTLLCTIKHLNLAFGAKTLFDDTGFHIESGDHIGLLALNGRGKSTLFKVLEETIKPDPSVPKFAYDRRKHPPLTLFHIPQEPPLADVRHQTIRDYLVHFYPEVIRLDDELQQLNNTLEQRPDETLLERQGQLLDKIESLAFTGIRQNYESLLREFSIDDLERSVLSLSGGEQKKVLLSVGLSSVADIILWDEPTNHLDLDAIRQFEDRLKQCRNAFILVSHDRRLLSAVTTVTYHIEHFKIVRFNGNYVNYLEHLYTRDHERMRVLEKLQNTMRRETEWLRQGVKARGTRSKKRVENAHLLTDKITALKAQARKKLDLDLAHSRRRTRKLFELRDYVFSYNERDPVIAIDQATVMRGDKIGLLGGNGAGKSTLIKLICNELQAQQGTRQTADDLQICHFSQNRQELDLDKTPAMILGKGSDQVVLGDGRTLHVAAYFTKFLFDRGELHRPLHTFSGGERNRLQMALNLTSTGDLWIFDEPTNDLDLETLAVLEEELCAFQGSLILVSHDRAFLSMVTNKVWLLEEGGIQSFEGGYDQVEEWLEANAIEKELGPQSNAKDKGLAGKDLKESATPNTSLKKQCLSFKEKRRISEIGDAIATVERAIDAFTVKLSQFDFSSSTESTRQEYQQWSTERESLEEELLALYEESETLDARANPS